MCVYIDLNKSFWIGDTHLLRFTPSNVDLELANDFNPKETFRGPFSGSMFVFVGVLLLSI